MAPGTHPARFRSQAEPHLAVRWPTHWAASIVASNRDELYVNLGCLRKCVQVAGI